MNIGRITRAAAAAILILTTGMVRAQDEVWDHQQRIQAQQAEEQRLNQMAGEAYADPDDAGPGGPGYAPNVFVSFPPEAWDDWVQHGMEQSRREEEARFASNPAYQELMRGTWTFRESVPNARPQICEATFWTRGGGVSFIHLGGTPDLTLLGFFGPGIPWDKKPRTLELELVQSGEVQKVRTVNLRFGAVKSMGMALFNVHSPQVLIGAIEDRQDFALRLGGETIAQGAWHSGLEARDTLVGCLKRQGYL